MRLFFHALSVFVILSCLAPLWIGERALLVKSEKGIFFPAFRVSVLSGRFFGLDYDYETNYRELNANHLKMKTTVVMPLIPFGPNEIIENLSSYPPTPPDWGGGHFLGTDTIGRDLLARLIYGFRQTLFFSLVLGVGCYFMGMLIGGVMGYYGGMVDLLGQRLLEIWSELPHLYLIMIIMTLIPVSFLSLVGVSLLISWTRLTWYIRGAILQEKNKTYVWALKSMDYPSWRILLWHIFPNISFLLLSFLPFTLASGFTLLVSLDYLGFGLPSPTPSLGEILNQGLNVPGAYWMTLPVIGITVVMMLSLTFLGERLR